jgi:membrane fusion protein, macrolide-specific efflux system
VNRVAKLAALGVTALATLAASLYGWQAWSASRAGTERFLTAAVERTDLEDVVTATGTLQPRDYVDVGTQVSGQLQKLHVEIGSMVKKGELLAEIDPTVYRSRVDADQAQLRNLNAQRAEAQAKLALAEQQLKRQQNLMKADATTADALQSAQAAARVGAAQLEALKAQVQQTESTLRGDEANLGYTKIYAPMAGTVVSQTAKEGQTLNANQQAPIILRIADLDTMTVWAQVAESDVVKLSPGMPAYFTTLGLTDRRWQGTVQQIQPTPVTLNDVVLYNVLIDVDNADHVLMTSMTAQVFFVLGEAKNVPIVPVAALSAARSGAPDEYEVRVLTADGPRRQAVKIGLADRTSAQIVSGLAVGDQVIVGSSNAAGISTRTAGGASARNIFGFRL